MITDRLLNMSTEPFLRVRAKCLAGNGLARLRTMRFVVPERHGVFLSRFVRSLMYHQMLVTMPKQIVCAYGLGLQELIGIACDAILVRMEHVSAGCKQHPVAVQCKRMESAVLCGGKVEKLQIVWVSCEYSSIKTEDISPWMA